MGDRSAIEWTDASWNPVTGCSKVSPGCAHCYAETLSLRFGRSAGPWTPANAAANVVLHPERLDQPLRWQRPRMIFVNSMSDLFHEQISDEYIARVFAVMAAAERHTFQVLTKRADRMRKLLCSQSFLCQVIEQLPAQALCPIEWPAPNVWLGVSIENRRFVHRADELRTTPAAARFISAEPLLGPLVGVAGQHGATSRRCARCGRTYLQQHTHHEREGWICDNCFREGEGYPIAALDRQTPGLSLAGIGWLIVGGESGPHHRPMRPEWVRDLRSVCQREGVAFFFKQWGGRTPKAGGRELDGRTWDEMPALAIEGAR